MSDESKPWSSWIVACLIAIAALMIYWKLETLHSRREPARRANCSSNLRQVGLSMALYAGMYNNWMPMDSANPTLLGSMQLLTSVTASAGIMHCPDDLRGKGKAAKRFDKLTRTNLSYSYVPNLKWQQFPDSIVACDRIYTTKKGGTWPTNGNHKGAGGNVLLLDGRVKFVTALPVELKDQNGVEIVLSP